LVEMLFSPESLFEQLRTTRKGVTTATQSRLRSTVKTLRGERFMRILPNSKWYPRQGSNLISQLRRLVRYPLHHGGGRLCLFDRWRVQARTASNPTGSLVKR
jgi:hypothetical protein